MGILLPIFLEIDIIRDLEYRLGHLSGYHASKETGET